MICGALPQDLPLDKRDWRAVAMVTWFGYRDLLVLKYTFGLTRNLHCTSKNLNETCMKQCVFAKTT